MLSVETIASGSSGNCYRIWDGQTNILIECGIRFREIREALDFQLSEISGCLVSHEHQDHCKAAKDIVKAGIDCYMSHGTAESLNLSGHRIKTVKPKQKFEVGTYTVLPFSTEHDAVEPLGFLIQSSNKTRLLYISDSYYCRYRFKNVGYFLVECNYAREILEENIKSGVTPPAIKSRILRSHFELENVKQFFKVNDLSGCREIHLIHISNDNGDPELFKSEIRKLTGKPVYVH